MPASLRLLTSLALVTAVGSAGTLPAVEAARAEPAPGAAGIGDPYYPRDGNGGIDVRHYDVGVTYRFTPARVVGDTTLTIRAKQDLSRFHLDLLLPVSSVEVDGTAAAYSKPHRHELRITPATAISEGDVFEVRVEYAGNPERLSYNGESNWLADADEVVTMNEPHMAPWWFPANDHPRDKATFDIAVTTDADKDVISNGERVGAPVVDGDLATTTWRMAEPMTTYLAYFAAGDYVVSEGTSAGIPWVTAVSTEFDAGQRERFRRIVNRSGRVTAWLEGRLGAYPFDSTGGLVTALPAGFALENQTRPTYAGGIGTGLLVHELAHQWFGNSVSLRRWRDIWLNEGFATYLQVAYAAGHGGRPVGRWLDREYRLHRGDPRFWRVDLTDPGPEIHRLFSWPVYARGAMTLAALRGKIGARTLDRLLRRWATERQHGVGTVPGFIRMAERAAGRPLDRFFRVWLRSPEPPSRTRANGF